MKNSIFSLAAIVGLVSAQFPGVPDCAQDCLTTAISSVGCPITDVGCQCSSTAEIQGFGAGCILAACTAEGDLASAISGGQGLCVEYLATVSASTTAESSAEATTTSTVTETSSEAVETSTVTAITTSIPSPTMNMTILPTGTGAPTMAPTPSEIPVGGAQTLVAGISGVAALAVAFLAYAL
jgi:hypothetical protein